MVVFNMIALVAQSAEPPALNRKVAGSTPAGCTLDEKENDMERLISLFREPDYEQWSPSQAQPPPREHDEPLYFEQLLEYLREERADERELVERR